MNWFMGGALVGASQELGKTVGDVAGGLLRGCPDDFTKYDARRAKDPKYEQHVIQRGTAAIWGIWLLFVLIYAFGLLAMLGIIRLD